MSFELAAKLRRTPIRLSPKTSMASTVASLGIRSLHILAAALPVEHTTARELGLLTGPKFPSLPAPALASTSS